MQKTKTNTALAIFFVAMAVSGLLGVVSITIVTIQQAQAEEVKIVGCNPGREGPGQGFFSSDRKCFHVITIP